MLFITATNVFAILSNNKNISWVLYLKKGFNLLKHFSILVLIMQALCLCTKALHLELVSELSSQAFLAALRRFTSRRGRVFKLYSDNGTNFVGASKILQNELRKSEITWKSELKLDFKQLGIEWHFNPPSTPHFGGRC